MADDRRSDSDIRRDITAEREQLADAVTDLRDSVAAKRKPAAMIGGAVAAGLAAVAATRLVRRFTRR